MDRERVEEGGTGREPVERVKGGGGGGGGGGSKEEIFVNFGNWLIVMGI